MRICNKALVLAALAITAIFTDPARAGTNLLTNGSFEVQGNGNDETAFRWNFNNPDTHAGYWGSFARRSWRSHSGTWEGTLQGRWIGVDFGGVWQEGPATPGTTYEASGWFFSDVPGTFSGGPFTAAVQELKIEFYSASFGSPLLTVQTNIFGGEAFSQKTLRATAPLNAAWARWVVAVSGTSPNGALQFDDVELRAITLRDQNFNDWTSNGSDGTHVRDDWTVSTGKTQTASARSGYCANLGNAGTVATNGHFIKSTQLADGIGTISFWYRPEVVTNAMTYDVQTSVNGTNWVTVGGITNILAVVVTNGVGTNAVTNIAYQSFTKFVYQPTQKYARIYHVAGSGRLLVDDISIAEPTPIQRFLDFDDWPTSYSSNSCYSYAGWDLCTGSVNVLDVLVGQAGSILGSTAGGNYLKSPLFSNGVGTVTYRYRALTNTTAIGFSVQTSTNGTTWTTYTSYTGITNDSYFTNSEAIYLPNGGYIRFLYNSGNGNSLLLEDIDVGYPLLSRTQNFDSWPNDSSYGDYAHQGWFVHEARIITNNALFGTAATLRDTVSAGAYIQSPFFPDGVGTITFSYLVDDSSYPTSGFGVRYLVQTSTDGVTWVTNDSIANLTNNLNFQQYEKYNFITNGSYVRIFHTNGSSRVVFDEITIAAPTAPADVVINGSHRPVSPYTNDTVSLYANVLPYNGAGITSLVSYYRVGTSGAFTALGMIPTNVVNYATTSAIAPQVTGTKVQYFIRCDFSGPASASNSPRYYPSGGSNNPASYSIPRNQPGSVWINEFNYINDYDFGTDTQEFVEVAGPAGTDISGWQIQLWLGSGLGGNYTYATYTLTNGTVFPNDNSGYGFFVLGDYELLTYDMPLTITNTYVGDGSHISDGLVPSGIRLVNEAGGEEQAIAYEGSLVSFTNVYAKEQYPDFDPYSVQLIGTGGAYTAFIWTNQTGMTPGSVNTGQSFPPDENAPPEVYFSSLVLGTNITMYYYGNSSNWTVAPYQTTNLSSPQTWSPVTPFSSSTNAVWFDRPSTGAQYIFRLNITN